MFSRSVRANRGEQARRAAHTLTNSAVNFVPVRSAEGLDPGLSIRMTVFTVLMLAGLVVIRRVSNACHLPQVSPWGA
jgi:hypothetical protein